MLVDFAIPHNLNWSDKRSERVWAFHSLLSLFRLCNLRQMHSDTHCPVLQTLAGSLVRTLHCLRACARVCLYSCVNLLVWNLSRDEKKILYQIYARQWNVWNAKHCYWYSFIRVYIDYSDSRWSQKPKHLHTYTFQYMCVCARLCLCALFKSHICSAPFIICVACTRVCVWLFFHSVCFCFVRSHLFSIWSFAKQISMVQRNDKMCYIRTLISRIDTIIARKISKQTNAPIFTNIDWTLASLLRASERQRNLGIVQMKMQMQWDWR